MRFYRCGKEKIVVTADGRRYFFDDDSPYLELETTEAIIAPYYARNRFWDRTLSVLFTLMSPLFALLSGPDLFARSAESKRDAASEARIRWHITSGHATEIRIGTDNGLCVLNGRGAKSADYRIRAPLIYGLPIGCGTVFAAAEALLLFAAIVAVSLGGRIAAAVCCALLPVLGAVSAVSMRRRIKRIFSDWRRVCESSVAAVTASESSNS